MAGQGQLPRPWFRLGSITRPTTVPTTAPPVTEPPRPALVRPPIIRPAALTEPSEPTSPPISAANKSPPAVGTKSPPTAAAAVPRPTTSIPSSPSVTKKVASPPATTFTRPVLPSPSSVHGHRAGSSAHSSPPQKAASPSATMPAAKSTPFSASDSKERVSLPPSPINSDSPINRTFPSRSPSPSPVPSPAAPSPYQSPKPKAPASPPSPLILPPSQLQSVGEPKHDSIPQEVERKTVVVQKMVDKPAQSDHFSSYHAHNHGFGKNGKQEVHRVDDQGKEKGMRAKKVMGSDQESNMRVITMAGENRGAFMEVILSDKNNSRQIRQNNNDSENEEGSHNNNAKGDRSKKSMGTRNSLPMKSFFNSNVQGINNSILLDSAFTHHDPGIHIVLSRMPPSTNDLDDGQQ